MIRKLALLSVVLLAGCKVGNEGPTCNWDDQVVECSDGHCWLRCPGEVAESE